MLVRDDVEGGEEKLLELQQELQDMGLFSSDFELGDLLDLDGSDDSETGKGGGGDSAKRKKLPEYPHVEGEESLQEFLGQYRRAVLSRKALLKQGKDRLDKDGATGHEHLGYISPVDRLHYKYYYYYYYSM